jgi:8-oxo-dGTP pyrophosphatase MutT (NUDIX family)
MKTIEIIGENYSGCWEHTRPACRGIILRENRLLLSYETRTGLWMLPGGGLEAGEEEKACCIREVAEETGFLIRPSDCLLEVDEYYENWKFPSRYFPGEITGSVPTQLTPREVSVGMEPRWLPPDEILAIFGNYAAEEEIRRGIYLREYTALRTLLPLLRPET